MSKTINYNINFTAGSSISLSGGTQTLGNLFTTGGNIGIGITAPSNTLHVNGDLRVSSFITTSNLICTNLTTNSLSIPIISDVPAIDPNMTNTLIVHEDFIGTTLRSGTTSGTAVSYVTSATGGYLQLTPASTNQSGYLSWKINPGNAFTIIFDHFAGGGNGSDAIFFNWSSDSVRVVSTGYAVEFNERRDYIRLLFNGVVLATSATITNLDNLTWHKSTITFYRNQIRVIYDGVVVINYTDTTFRNVNGAYMYFYSFTGTDTNFHRIRNIRMSKLTEGLWQYQESTSGNIVYNGGNVGIGTAAPSNTLHIGGSMLVSGLITTTNLVASAMSTGSLNATGVTTSNLLVTGLISAANLFATNISSTNLASTNISSTNLVATNISISSLSFAGLSNLPNVVSTNISTSDLTTTDITTSHLVSTNISSTNLVVTNITANGLVSLRSTRGILIGSSTDLDTGRLISALDSGMTAGSVRFITLGQSNSTNNQAELGFQYVGNNNTQNSLTFGLFGGEEMRIQANGFVGINTSSPIEMLDIRGNIRVGGSTQANYIAFNGVSWDMSVATSGAAHSFIGERLWGGNDQSELLLFKGNDARPDYGPDRIRLLASEVRFDTGVETEGTFEGIGTFGSTKMIIATSGNVGIGTTNPSYTLDISSNSLTDAVRIRNLNASGYASIAYNNNNAFWFGGVGGSNAPSYAGSYYIVSDNATFVGRQNGNWGINEQLPNSTLHIKSRFSTSGNLLAVNGTNPTDNYLGNLRNGNFYSTVANDRGGVTIDKDNQNPGDNHLLIRTCAVGSANFNFIMAQTNLSAAQGFQNGTATGSVDQFFVRGNGEVVNRNGSYSGYSDIKLKENIEDARNYLEDLSKLRVVKYSFKNENLENPNQLGLIAQEVEQVFPGLIGESEDKDSEGNSLGTSTKSIKYSIINIMMLKAVQELRESNNKLNTLLQDQEKEIKMLKDFIMTKFPGELN